MAADCRRYSATGLFPGRLMSPLYHFPVPLSVENSVQFDGFCTYFVTIMFHSAALRR